MARKLNPRCPFCHYYNPLSDTCALRRLGCVMAGKPLKTLREEKKRKLLKK